MIAFSIDHPPKAHAKQKRTTAKRNTTNSYDNKGNCLSAIAPPTSTVLKKSTMELISQIAHCSIVQLQAPGHHLLFFAKWVVRPENELHLGFDGIVDPV